MSTSYYAQWKKFTEGDEQMKIHLGSTSNNSILLSGVHFSRWAEMKSFLRKDEEKLTIVNEYETELSLDELVELFEGKSQEQRRKHYRFLLTDPLYSDRVRSAPTDEVGTTWLDPEGFSIYNGDFS